MFGGGFGQSQPAQSTQPAGGSLFGNVGTQSTAGGLFGQSTAQTQPPKGSLFGQPPQQQQQQQQPTNLFGQTQQQQQPQSQPTGSLFGGFGLGNNQQAQQATNPFGGALSQNNQQSQLQTTGLFGGLGAAQQQQQARQPQQGFGQSLFGQTEKEPYERAVLEQMATVVSKWNPQQPECTFKYYFYNKVDENQAPLYGPNLSCGEDPQAWEEALSKKPGPGYIPVLCTGFVQLSARMQLQSQNKNVYSNILHQINDKLTELIDKHDTSTSIRVMEAKRKHVVLKQRCLALATKVQILRNRGYALNGDEEDVKIKLKKLDSAVSDPGLGARSEEIWARMVSVQERGQQLRAELARAGAEQGEVLDEALTQQAKKILEDYQKQLTHLKKELDHIQADYVQWEKEQTPTAARTSPKATRSTTTR